MEIIIIKYRESICAGHSVHSTSFMPNEVETLNRSYFMNMIERKDADIIKARVVVTSYKCSEMG